MKMNSKCSNLETRSSSERDIVLFVSERAMRIVHTRPNQINVVVSFMLQKGCFEMELLIKYAVPLGGEL